MVGIKLGINDDNLCRDPQYTDKTAGAHALGSGRLNFHDKSSRSIPVAVKTENDPLTQIYTIQQRRSNQRTGYPSSAWKYGSTMYVYR